MAAYKTLISWEQIAPYYRPISSCKTRSVEAFRSLLLYAISDISHDAMNRFSAAALVNISAVDQPSYKAVLLSVIEQQKQGISESDAEWLEAMNFGPDRDK